MFDNHRVNVPIGGEIYALELFDTAGQEDYESIRQLAYPQTDVFLVCYSLVNPSSYENVSEKWVPEIQQYCPNTPFILVGTQMDLRDNPGGFNAILSKENGERLAKRLGAAKYMECSALTQVRYCLILINI